MSRNVLRRQHAKCSACGATVEIRNGVLSAHADLFSPVGAECERSRQAPELVEHGLIEKIEDVIALGAIIIALAMFFAGDAMLGGAGQ